MGELGVWLRIHQAPRALTLGLLLTIAFRALGAIQVSIPVDTSWGLDARLIHLAPPALSAVLAPALRTGLYWCERRSSMRLWCIRSIWVLSLMAVTVGGVALASRHDFAHAIVPGLVAAGLTSITATVLSELVAAAPAFILTLVAMISYRANGLRSWQGVLLEQEAATPLEMMGTAMVCLVCAAAHAWLLPFDLSAATDGRHRGRVNILTN